MEDMRRIVRTSGGQLEDMQRIVRICGGHYSWRTVGGHVEDS